MAGKYPLGPLLRARAYREEAAAREAGKARTAVREAEEALEAARQEWRRYREWRPGEEVRLFELLRGRVVAQTALDRHREDIERLRAGELHREELCREAEKSLAAAERALAEAVNRHAQASRDKRKLEEHQVRWRRLEALREEKAEEAELEDFQYTPPETME